LYNSFTHTFDDMLSRQLVNIKMVVLASAPGTLVKKAKNRIFFIKENNFLTFLKWNI